MMLPNLRAWFDDVPVVGNQSKASDRSERDVIADEFPRISPNQPVFWWVISTCVFATIILP